MAKRNKGKIKCNNCKCTVSSDPESILAKQQDCMRSRCMIKGIKINKAKPTVTELPKAKLLALPKPKEKVPENYSPRVKDTEYEGYTNVEVEDPILIHINPNGSRTHYKFKGARNIYTL